jgi:PAS domain S-box-containing protein
VSEVLHRALYALPDVALAVEGRSLRIIDINRAGETFGYSRTELLALGLDALLDSPRDELAQCIAASDRSVIASRVKCKDGNTVRVSLRASTSAAAASTPCVVVVVRDLPLAPTEIEDARRALRTALASLEVPEPEPADEPTRETPQLSLEQHACLEVETELGWDPIERINSRYGLTEPLRAVVDQHWRERLASDPELEREHGRLMDQYFAWFQANRRTSSHKPSDAIHETKSKIDMFLMSAEVIPFRPPEVPDFTVEQYAGLTVEMAANPKNHAQVLELYGIASEAVWHACEAHWEALLKADPNLRKRWMRLVSDLRGKLAR